MISFKKITDILLDVTVIITRKKPEKMSQSIARGIVIDATTNMAGIQLFLAQPVVDYSSNGPRFFKGYNEMVHRFSPGVLRRSA